jgi:hypothetical protein
MESFIAHPCLLGTIFGEPSSGGTSQKPRFANDVRAKKAEKPPAPGNNF